jgi:hypothetical protein
MAAFILLAGATTSPDEKHISNTNTKRAKEYLFVPERGFDSRLHRVVASDLVASVNPPHELIVPANVMHNI